MDFTIDTYQSLLAALTHQQWRMQHDVDARPERALRIAQVEAEAGVSSTYYFRAMHFAPHAGTIRAIAALGHTVGYHYEDLATCHGDVARAYDLFCRHLEQLRQLVPVSTACAHGSPRSPWNSQDLWLKHDIHTLGIDHEPMLDTDFDRTLYLTDTGRRWDGHRVSVRDKVASRQPQWEAEGLRFHSTPDLIRALGNPLHPIHRHPLLLNTHPQRWMPFGAAWLAEACSQWCKNQAKRLIVMSRQ